MNDQKAKNQIIDLLADEISARQRLSNLVARHFVIGIAYGLGASVGAAAIIAIIVYVYRNFLIGLITPTF